MPILVMNLWCCIPACPNIAIMKSQERRRKGFQGWVFGEAQEGGASAPTLHPRIVFSPTRAAQAPPPCIPESCLAQQGRRKRPHPASTPPPPLRDREHYYRF